MDNMNGRKSYIFAIILNAAIFLFTVLACCMMFSGFHFMTDPMFTHPIGSVAFRYFTVDSNVLMGLTALMFVIMYIKLQRRSIIHIPKWMYLLKLAATTGVGLTMLVTVCFLAPTSKTGYFSLFMDSDLFLHFIIPVLSIICFIVFDTMITLRFKETILGTVPMLIYAGYYLTNALLHMENGTISTKYDWYGFLFMGVKSLPVVLLIIIFVTWAISILLWILAKKHDHRS